MVYIYRGRYWVVDRENIFIIVRENCIYYLLSLNYTGFRLRMEKVGVDKEVLRRVRVNYS